MNDIAIQLVKQPEITLFVWDTTVFVSHHPPFCFFTLPDIHP